MHTYVVFPGGALVNNPPASPGDAGDAGSIPGKTWEDPREWEAATPSSISSWEIPTLAGILYFRIFCPCN